MEGDAGEIPTICLLGGTGTGKSSTGNSIFKRSDVFETSDDTASMTCQPTIKALKWRWDGELVRCVDLPGLADTQGRDHQHIEAMAEALKTEVKYVHVFLVIINSEVPRFDWQLQEMLIKFKDVFGEEFLRNVMLGFTKWEFKRFARKKREKTGQTEAVKAKKYNEVLRSILKHEFDCPCVFLNNNLNALSEEDLEAEYGAEVPEMQKAFEAELQKVHSFMRSREPFMCRNIEAMLAEREEMKKWVRSMMPRAVNIDAERLGRNLILADTDFIRGWLRWRRPPGPPRTVWAVVRRQQLQVFSDDTEAELVGPEEIELLNCICGKAGWHLLSKRCFLIYKAVQGPSSSFAMEMGARTAEKYEFGVDSERERRKWMFLVQEATRISESWSRILASYESLHSARSLDEYVQAIRKVASETMVVPMEWVRLCKRKRQGAADAAQPDKHAERRQWEADLAQAQKDLTRDCVLLDSRMLQCPSVDDLAADVVLRLLKGTKGMRCAEEYADEKALLLARDVVVFCSRSTTSGDIFEAVQELFSQEDLVHTVVDQRDTAPVCVRILRPDGPERVLQQDFLRTLDSSTGLPQFQSDPSAAALDIEQVRNMSVEEEQRLQATRVAQDSWVPDWETLQCMKCGIPFGTWVWRHHCRHCGALICSSCSQHSLELVAAEREEGGVPGRREIGRVCFSCYQKAVIEDLSARRSVASVGSSDTTQDSKGEAEGETPTDALQAESEQGEASMGSFTSSFADEGNDWPVISIEMTSTYRVCNMELKELFLVHCRHVRQVRWSGVSDAGRVVISIGEKEDSSLKS
mmetsp:Transcript_61349/g.182752  ORF Transcript_61349/g.182752 Transcript_61349/m.182752 type:complete len:807 (-) Transcript_61349:138-2558(-)